MAKKQVKHNAKSLPDGALEAVRGKAEELASSHGLMVHDVTFGPTDFGLTLSVVIKSQSGSKPTSISDCELVSRPLSKMLDDLLAGYDEHYMFEVTSVGVEKGEA